MEMRWEQNVVWNWTLGRGKHILQNHGRHPIICIAYFISVVNIGGNKKGTKEWSKAPHKLQVSSRHIAKGVPGAHEGNVM